jgi:hypothetical protein
MKRPAVVASARGLKGSVMPLMDLEPSSRWETLLLSLEQAEEMLMRATFILLRRDGSFGTGFFFTKDGLGLTADHVVRDERPRRSLEAYYKGRRLRMEWVVDWSSERADIAAVCLIDRPEDLEVESLPVAYLDPSLPARTRRQYWGGRSILIWGYPRFGKVQRKRWTQEGRSIDGAVNLAYPLVSSVEFDGAVERQRIDRLNMHGSCVDEPEGISGAAILDRELRVVIGVQGSYLPGPGEVRGTEIAQLVEEVPELKGYFSSLLSPLPSPAETPQRGVAVFAKPRDERLPTVLPITVHFCPSQTPTGEIAFDNEQLRQAAQAAVQWAGEYMRRFGGELARVFSENHWRQNAPYGCAIFSFPSGAYESLPQLQAGMLLAYLARILRDTLVHDLNLPCDFPTNLVVCAAGLGSGRPDVMGTQQFSEAVRRFQPEEAATVLYSRDQDEELRSLSDLPERVRFIPVDRPEHLAESLLAGLSDDLKRCSVDEHFAQLLKSGLKALYESEKSLQYAKAACRSREARINDLEMERSKRVEQLSFLEDKIREIKEGLVHGVEVPLPSQVLAEFARIEEAWEEKRTQELNQGTGGQTEIEVVVVVDPEFLSEPEVCKRLFRRLANLYHPDKNPAEPEWFPHLSEHREDRLWLEALDGASQPLQVESRGPGIEMQVEALMDRLFRLSRIHRGLADRIGRIGQEIESYGPVPGLDEEMAGRESIISALKYDIDQAWRELNWLVGREPFWPGEGAAG